MKNLLLSLLCAAPLVVGAVPQEAAQPAPVVEPATPAVVYVTSMGCDLAECADPTHYHYCVEGCTDPTHYHSCPLGCADPTHPHCNQFWEDVETETVAPFCNSMGCYWEDCTDPAHYHNCPVGCTELGHYHDCPLNGGNTDCPYYGQCWRTADPETEVTFRNGMGCYRNGCTETGHYHGCSLDCTDPDHYHDCPVGGQANQGYCGSWGYQGGRQGHHGGRHH